VVSEIHFNNNDPKNLALFGAGPFFTSAAARWPLLRFWGPAGKDFFGLAVGQSVWKVEAAENLTSVLAEKGLIVLQHCRHAIEPLYVFCVPGAELALN
jgi:hypothetical protein